MNDVATKTAAAGLDYDSLSQDEQDAHDAIARAGWTPEPSGRGWKAVKDGSADLGPFPTLTELADVVGDSDLEEVDLDEDDGFELTNEPERQKDEKKLVMALMHKFEDELQADPDTGNKFYQVEMIRATLEITEKEDLKTEKIND